MGKKEGKGLRVRHAYNPIAKRVVFVERDPYYAVPGRHGLAWDYLDTGKRERRMPYDPDSIKHAIKRHGSIAALCKAMCPHLNGERMAKLIETIHSISHAKQREHMGADPEHRERRLSKREKRAKRKANALQELRELLKQGK